ncbi:ABC-type glycerol-3-phosphate transport system substrate-binding protein [Bacillus niacini]|uniref:ABC-type glycerol-3-phosphate transport system substrate-binding protein n=1 Tax=Neobacillus niacini TaxID=86668 RepID=A0A852T4A2_9BACI|nr:sugar ABC transporter substrate-binding protein [Neobacillus niacini]NYE03393.1 ABC-type glycerol-3-phosphate transport system substrate-binding protein [Neobacillus niacini]
MKKWLTLIILLGLVGFGFFTLSGKSPDKEKPPKRVELTFLRNLANPAFNQAYEEMVAAFEATHPTIKINMQSMHWGSEYELRLRTELAAGNHPDIMAIDSPNLALYANSGSLLSIDSYMKAEGNIEDIPEGVLKGLTYKDEIYLAPIVESSIALFYNMNIFRDAGIPFPSGNPENPLTWNEVLEIAKKINNPAKGVIGVDPAQGFNVGEGPAYFKMPILWQFGADVISPDGSTAEGYLNSKEALEALQFYQDLYFKHRVATVEMPPTPFETDKLGMTVLGSWAISELQQTPGFVLGEDFGVAPLPKGLHQVVPNGGWALGISSKTKYPEEAWEFVKFATGYEGSKLFVEISGDLPARYSVAKDFPELNEYPKNIFVQQDQNYSKSRPVTPAYPVISEAIKDLFEDVGQEGKNVEEAANIAVEKINNGLKDIKK